MQEKTRKKLITGSLVLVIFIMMVQNYMLVKKDENNRGRIERLTEQVSRLGVFRRGDQFPIFAARDVDSISITLPGNNRIPKLFFVYTTHCPACKENMEHCSLTRSLATRTIDIYGICMDSLDQLRNFLAAETIGFRSFSIGNDTTIGWRLRAFSIPQTILLDSTGAVVSVWKGILSDERVHEILDAI